MNTEQSSQDQTLTEQREDFLAVLNHRLRTPILAMIRALDLVIDGEFGAMTQAQSEIITLVKANADELDRLLTMLADIYRYKNHSKFVQKEPHNIVELLSELCLPHGQNHDHKTISLQTEFPERSIIVKCDRAEIETLFRHLIENGMKHARAFVRIKAETDTRNRCAVITIADDGKGIREDDQADLFERFFVVSKDRKYAPAAGTGLCLCAEICKAHQGHIECSSEYGKGTTFSVTLPC